MLVEFQQLLLSMVVLFAIVLGTGEPLTWYWLLLTPSMQAYCHPDIATGELWLAGIGWAVVIIVAGVLYFWQAETRYGRG